MIGFRLRPPGVAQRYSPMRMNGMSPALPAQMAGPVLGQPQLGQDIDELLPSVVTLIDALPADEALKYRTRLNECRSQIDAGGVGIVTGGACLWELFKDLKALLDEPEPARPTPIVFTQPSDFPWIPVGLGVVGAGILAYFALKG